MLQLPDSEDAMGLDVHAGSPGEVGDEPLWSCAVTAPELDPALQFRTKLAISKLILAPIFLCCLVFLQSTSK